MARNWTTEREDFAAEWETLVHQLSGAEQTPNVDPLEEMESEDDYDAEEYWGENDEELEEEEGDGTDHPRPYRHTLWSQVERSMEELARGANISQDVLNSLRNMANGITESTNTEPLTVEETFMVDEGMYCPVCRSVNFLPNINRPRTTKSVIVLDNACEDCESTWTTTFVLDSIDNIEDNTGMDDNALKRLGIG